MTPYTLYNLLLFFSAPIAALVYLYKAVFRGKTRRGIWQQLGRYPVTDIRARIGDKRPIIWVHAVSVGEVMAANAVVRALRQELPEACIALSTTTDSGYETAERNVEDADLFLYYPLDWPSPVNAALDAVRPDIYIFMETEIWPNFLHYCHERGVKTIQANGRISLRAARNYRFTRYIIHWALDRVDAFAMRSAADAERLQAMIDADERILLAGEVKMDQPLQKLPEGERAALRSELGLEPQERLLLAGSTHEGEEELLLDAFWQAHMRHPSLRLMLAPRHVERCDAVERLVIERGHTVCRCTELRESAQTPRDSAVLLLDTTGELARMYGAADIAFVGGSLIPRGGHNVLEPAIQGRPVVVGPHTHNFGGLCALLRESGVMWEAATADELADRISELVGDEQILAAVAERAAATVRNNRGASRRIARLAHQLWDASRLAAQEDEPEE